MCSPRRAIVELNTSSSSFTTKPSNVPRDAAFLANVTLAASIKLPSNSNSLPTFSKALSGLPVAPPAPFFKVSNSPANMPSNLALLRSAFSYAASPSFCSDFAVLHAVEAATTAAEASFMAAFASSAASAFALWSSVAVSTREFRLVCSLSAEATFCSSSSATAARWRWTALSVSSIMEIVECWKGWRSSFTLPRHSRTLPASIFNTSDG
mmetsp:Transcript_65678/g.129198  ORF Transcript_65678/g.129198 Transcript_65678/m.129198 type:complete len:210 (-) Transcript_65678:137-766(-)